MTLGYRDAVKELDDKDVRYQEFDFHHECKKTVPPVLTVY